MGLKFKAMTDAEEKALVLAAYVESCTCWPAVTYAMEKAAVLVDPTARPVTDTDFRQLYKCPFFPGVQQMRGQLKEISEDGKARMIAALQDMKAAAREDFEQVRGIDPAKEASGKKCSRDAKLAAFVTKQDNFDLWTAVIKALPEAGTEARARAAGWGLC